MNPRFGLENRPQIVIGYLPEVMWIKYIWACIYIYIYIHGLFIYSCQYVCIVFGHLYLSIYIYNYILYVLLYYIISYHIISYDIIFYIVLLYTYIFMMLRFVHVFFLYMLCFIHHNEKLPIRWVKRSMGSFWARCAMGSKLMEK